MQKILISGDRNYSDFKTIEYTVLKILNIYPPEKYVLIHGGCRGADKLTENAFKKFKYLTIEMHAEWDKYGKAAGPIRNKEMVKLHPDLFLIFHDDLKNSRGTKNCVNIMLKEINESYNPICILNSEIISVQNLKELIN